MCCDLDLKRDKGKRRRARGREKESCPKAKTLALHSPCDNESQGDKKAKKARETSERLDAFELSDLIAAPPPPSRSLARSRTAFILAPNTIEGGSVARHVQWSQLADLLRRSRGALVA